MFERVHTVTDFWDGPIEGIADLAGHAHLFKAVWDADRDAYADSFMLAPLDAETLSLALEDWEIWKRWEDAFHQGLADHASHPALPSDRKRHEELQHLLAGRLVIDPARAVRKRAEFRVHAPTDALEVCWHDPA